MSYAITCYHSDYTIAKTQISISALGLNYELVPEAQDDNGDDASWERSGFTYNAKFTAVAASGCKFVRWVYRVGSQTASVQYSTANPFTYTGGQDIWIRAEGEVDSSGSDGGGDGSIGEWTIKSSSIGRLAGTYSKYYSMGAFNYTMYRIAVIFTQSGTAKFYAETGMNGEYLDSYGYLSTTTEYILVEKGGRRVPTPVDILIEDDDSGETATSFQFSYNVEAGVTYYL